MSSHPAPRQEIVQLYKKMKSALDQQEKTATEEQSTPSTCQTSYVFGTSTSETRFPPLRSSLRISTRPPPRASQIEKEIPPINQRDLSAASTKPKTLLEKELLEFVADSAVQLNIPLDVPSTPPHQQAARSTPQRSSCPAPAFENSPIPCHKRRIVFDESDCSPEKASCLEDSFDEPSMMEPQNDPTWVPSESRCDISEEDKSYMEHKLEDDDSEVSDIDDDTDAAEMANEDSDGLIMVSMKQILELLKNCKICGKKNGIDIKKTGAFCAFYCTCTGPKKHKYKWTNHEEVHEKKPVINIQLTSAIFITGLNFAPILRLAKLLKLAFFGKTTYYNIIGNYVKPVLCDRWYKMRKATLDTMKEAEDQTSISGDARFDSRGKNSAKFGVYTLMDSHSDKIIDFAIMQKGLVPGELESKAMLLTFGRVVNAVGADKIKALCTDRNYTVGKKMKDFFPMIYHAFDVSYFINIFVCVLVW